MMLPLLGLGAVFAYFAWRRRVFSRWIRDGEEWIHFQSGRAPDVSRESLPLSLRKYLARAFVEAPTSVRSLVRFSQTGIQLEEPRGAELSFVAEYLSSTVTPAFSWRADCSGSSLVCERLVNEEAAFESRWFGVYSQTSGSSGNRSLRAALMRYLAEIPWNPWIILTQPALQWKQLGSDEVSVRAELGGVVAQLRFEIGYDGTIVHAKAESRPRMVGDAEVETPWGVSFFDYQAVNGVLIPKRAEWHWYLGAKTFTYCKMNVSNYRVY